MNARAEFSSLSSSVTGAGGYSKEKRLMTRNVRQRRPVSRVLCPERFPGPRGDDHFSTTPVTRRLQRPNPGAARAPPLLPYLAVLRVGVGVPARAPAALVSSYLRVSPLPPRRPLRP